MKLLLSILCYGLFGTSLLASTQSHYDTIARPEHRLEASHLEMGWSHLFRQMRAVKNIEASFIEERFFKFRNEPKVYLGEFRKAEDGSISLAYTEQSLFVHVGLDFAFYREGEASPRAIPHSSSRRNTLILFPLLVELRIDELEQLYDLYGDFQGEGAWSLALLAKPETDLDYQRIGLSGVDASVHEILLEKNDKQRIHIQMNEITFPAEFDARVRQRYFFKPEHLEN